MTQGKRSRDFGKKNRLEKIQSIDVNKVKRLRRENETEEATELFAYRDKDKSLI